MNTRMKEWRTQNVEVVIDTEGITNRVFARFVVNFIFCTFRSIKINIYG